MTSARFIPVYWSVLANCGLLLSSQIIGSSLGPNMTSTPAKSKPKALVALRAKSIYSCLGSNLAPVPPLEMLLLKSFCFL